MPLPQFITGGSGQAFKRRRTVCDLSKNACYRFHDICRCGLRRNTIGKFELEDQILISLDGYPTYNFANVIV